MKARKYEGGFTLIELMIAVAIIGIIAAIAYPSYEESVAKARRSDAQGGLAGLATVLERFYTVNNTYKGAGNGGDTDSPPLPTLYPSQTPLDGATKFYNLTLSATTTTYTLRATPINGQVGDRCGNMTLTNAGVKSAGDENCWR